MISQDTGAFVEILEIPLADKQARKQRRLAADAQLGVLRARLDVRIAEEALKAMERAATAATHDDLGGSDRSPRPPRPSEKELEAVRARLAKDRARLARASEGARSLGLDSGGQRAEPTTRVYRFHSKQCHVEWSEARFARLTDAQRRRPVRVATKDGVRWWWYLDRFWQDDERSTAEEVRASVLDQDRRRKRRRRAQERARAEVLGPRRREAAGESRPAPKPRRAETASFDEPAESVSPAGAVWVVSPEDVEARRAVS